MPSGLLNLMAEVLLISLEALHLGLASVKASCSPEVLPSFLDCQTEGLCSQLDSSYSGYLSSSSFHSWEISFNFSPSICVYIFLPSCLSPLQLSCFSLFLCPIPLYTKPSRFWKMIARNACYQLITSVFAPQQKAPPTLETYPGYMCGRNVGGKIIKSIKSTLV